MKRITEESGEHKQWQSQAKEQTLKTLSDFINGLMNDYNHDYGTIIHAMAAGMEATFSAMNKDKQGGITGFQDGCLMWEVLRHSFHIKAPCRLVDYKDLLYPQYEYKFKCISQETWQQIQEMATKNLDDKTFAAEKVIEHWKSIANGKVPFGLGISEK